MSYPSIDPAKSVERTRRAGYFCATLRTRVSPKNERGAMRLRRRFNAMPKSLLRALSAAVFFSSVLAVTPAPALAEPDGKAAPELRTADDEFSKQLSELKKTFAELGKKF